MASKRCPALLILLLAVSPAVSAEIGDIGTSLKIKSRFIVREAVGPPVGEKSINRFAPSYLFEFKTARYSRDILFLHSDLFFVMLRDYYGVYELPYYQVISLPNYIGYRRDMVVKKSMEDEFRQKVGKSDGEDGGGAVQIDIPWEPPKLISGIIGEGKSNIRVTGSRSITFSGKSEWEDGLVNTGTFHQSKFPTLHMEQKSRFKVTGTIGSKITVEVDQDSERYTELGNTIKLRYKGDEDEIIQSVEAGNTNLALPNSQFIGYSENVQGLFGVKATAKVGNLDLTMITSQDRGSNEKARFDAGAKGSERQFRDYEYLPDTYFWLWHQQVQNPDQVDSLVLSTVELYTNGIQTEDPMGLAVVEPDTSLPNLGITDDQLDRVEYKYIPFRQVAPGDFDVFTVEGAVDQNRTWYVVLNRPLSQLSGGYGSNVLAAYIRYFQYRDGAVDTMRVGSLQYRPGEGEADTTLVLMLLKHDRATSPEWDSWERMWRNVYDIGDGKSITSEGFELRIFKGAGGQQGFVNDLEDQEGECFVTILGLDDVNNSDGSAGPDCLCDFDNSIIDAGRGHLIFPYEKPFDIEALDVRVPSIYEKTFNHTILRDSTRYYLYVKTSERASNYSLGRANIIEGSEVVKLGDGTPLQRGVDYNINYDIGQITFISERANSPGANVTVDYEYAPFFSPEKKTLFGLASQYRLFENSFISLAAMYRSETSSEPRPRVGQEPTRGFVWDGNFSFKFNPEFMTSMVDALPLIEADAPSTLDISGEVAQSFPNPNVKNQAFIDDFEGTRTYFDLSTRRGIWTACSPPVDADTVKFDRNLKASLWWYNPLQPIRIRQIWPERQDVRDQDDRQDVLFLEFFPDSLVSAPESTWAGIMRPVYSGAADQSQSKFIEFWYLPDEDVTSGAPTLHINLGLISEDIDDDGTLDSEDKDLNRVLLPSEDTGLDGLSSEDEPDYDPVNNPDPNGDDWYYSNEDEFNFARINGTENNRNDPDRLGRYDTEDINLSSGLDEYNGYFEYAIDLNDPRFWVDETSTGWRLLRIPMQDSTVYQVRGVNEADFSNIAFARMWLSEGTVPYLLKVASFQLVGNKWQEAPIELDSLDYTRPGERFEIAVKNTHENSDYDPPPGIAGELDRETGVREKEQSLALIYNNMPAGHLGAAYWSLYDPEDYTLYQRLQMFVHGDSSVDGNVIFFFRMSQDGANYYEYRTVLEPGWSENNSVDLDFARMTELKYELHRNTHPDSLAYADTVEGNYSIHGNPSLSQVRLFVVGVEIDTAAVPDSLYSGEVWVDELRVTEVRKKSDFAGRVQATARFSDFADATVSYQRTGADFFPLSAKIPSGSNTTSRSVRVGANVHKLFPPSLGMSLPVSASWQNTLSLPRLKPGSDVILQGEAQRREKTESTQRGHSASLGFNKSTRNPLWNLTLNRIRTNYSFSKTEGTSPATPESEIIRYQGGASYDLSPRGKPKFKLFYWTKYLLMPGSIYNSQFFFLPSKLDFSGDIKGNTSRSVNQRGIATSLRTKDLLLSGNAGYNPFSSIRSNYSVTSSRDLSDPDRFRLSINPSKLKLGQEQNFQQRFDVSFQPRIIRLVDHKVSFNSSYTEDSDLKRNVDSTRTTDMQGSLKTDVTLNFPVLFGGGGGRAPEKKPEKPGDISSPDSPEEYDDDEDDETGPGLVTPGKVFGGILKLITSIKPLRASYKKDKKFVRRGLIERPSWMYLFGFVDNPRAETKRAGGFARSDNTIFTDDYLLDSGLQPSQNLDVRAAYSLRTQITRGSTDPTKLKTVTFPDITVSLSGLETWPLFRALTRTVGFQFGYSERVDENGREDTGELYKRETATNYAPLFGLNLTFSNNIRGSVRYDKSSSISRNLRGEGQSDRQVNGSDNSLKVNFTYSFSAPQGLKLPLLKNLKFDSQLSLSLDLSIGGTKSESITSGRKSVDADRKSITVEPKLTYQFSRAITGGLRARWNDSYDKIQQRKHHVRELGIWTEIRF